MMAFKWHCRPIHPCKNSSWALGRCQRGDRADPRRPRRCRRLGRRWWAYRAPRRWASGRRRGRRAQSRGRSGSGGFPRRRCRFRHWRRGLTRQFRHSLWEETSKTITRAKRERRKQSSIPVLPNGNVENNHNGKSFGSLRWLSQSPTREEKQLD